MEQIALNLEQEKKNIREHMISAQEHANEIKKDFICIGYSLRRILDTGAYLADGNGYTDFNEFAEHELEIEKSMVNRYINVNKKYSADGYSQEMIAGYEVFNKSQLIAMMNIPEEDRTVIDAETPEKTIREYKGFLREEPKKEIEGQASFVEADVQQGENEHELKNLLIEFFKGKIDTLKFLSRNNYCETEDVCEKMNPSGNGTYKCGMTFLFMYGEEKGISYKIFGKQPVSMSWEELHTVIKQVFDDSTYNLLVEEENTKKRLEQEAKEQEEKEKAAAAQKAQEEQKKKEIEKQRVERQKKVEKQKKANATSQPKKEMAVAAVPEETQLPGQMEVKDYPEVMPEVMKVEKEESKSPENVEYTKCEENPEEIEKNMENEEILPECSIEHSVFIDQHTLVALAANIMADINEKDYALAKDKCVNLLNLLYRKVNEDGEE